MDKVFFNSDGSLWQHFDWRHDILYFQDIVHCIILSSSDCCQILKRCIFQSFVAEAGLQVVIYVFVLSYDAKLPRKTLIPDPKSVTIWSTSPDIVDPKIFMSMSLLMLNPMV